MRPPDAIEARVSTIERELDQLKRRLDAHPDLNWIRRIAGSFQDEPEFDQVLALGRAIRRATVRMIRLKQDDLTPIKARNHPTGDVF